MSRHVLRWTPGQRGNGLVVDGTNDVHTWNVDADGQPNHLTYAEDNGLPQRQLQPGLDAYSREPNVTFSISPAGRVEVYDARNSWNHSDEGWQAIRAGDPNLRLKGERAPWSLDDDAEPDWDHDMVGKYIVKGDQVAVGPVYREHANIVADHDLGWMGVDSAGYVLDNGKLEPMSGWQSPTPEQTEQVLKAYEVLPEDQKMTLDEWEERNSERHGSWKLATKVVEHPYDPEAEEEDEKEADLDYRRPFLYDKDEDVVHVGIPNEWHSELLGRTGAPPWHPGYVSDGSRKGTPAGVYWYDQRRQPPNAEVVKRAVEKHFNIEPNNHLVMNEHPDWDQDEWILGRVADINHRLNWMPGNEGRGLLLPGGYFEPDELHTWNSDAEHGPEHAEYLQKTLGRTNVIHEPFWISPSGDVDGHVTADLAAIDPRLSQGDGDWRLASTYVDDKVDELRKALKPSELPKTHADELLKLYALLALSKGKRVTKEDVHDAWVAWRSEYRKDHPSFKEYDELDEEKQDLDQPYVDAIHKVAGYDFDPQQQDSGLVQGRCKNCGHVRAVDPQTGLCNLCNTYGMGVDERANGLSTLLEYHQQTNPSLKGPWYARTSVAPNINVQGVGGWNGFEDDHSFWYHPRSQTVFIGGPDDQHYNILEELERTRGLKGHELEAGAAYDGDFTWYGNPEHARPVYDHLQREFGPLDPNAKDSASVRWWNKHDEPDQWKLGAAPKIVEGTNQLGEAAESQEFQDYWGQAWLYSPKHNTVYVAAPGNHHGDIVNEFDLPWEKNRIYGVIGRGRYGGPRIRFVGTGEPDYNYLIDLLGDKYDIGPDNRQYALGEDYWKLGASSLYREWQLGSYGKAIVWPDGNVKLWSADNPDYDTHHVDLKGANSGTHLAILPNGEAGAVWNANRVPPNDVRKALAPYGIRYRGEMQNYDPWEHEYWHLSAVVPEQDDAKPKYDDIFGDRIPVLFRPATSRFEGVPGADTLADVPDRLVFGVPGQTHARLGMNTGLLNEPGVAPYHGAYDVNTNRFKWLGESKDPRGHEDVWPLIQQKFPGAYYEPEAPWRMGKTQMRYTCPECGKHYTTDQCPRCGYRTMWQRVANERWETPPGLEPWREGLPGKELIDPEGRRWRWALPAAGDVDPAHHQVLRKHLADIYGPEEWMNLREGRNWDINYVHPDGTTNDVYNSDSYADIDPWRLGRTAGEYEDENAPPSGEVRPWQPGTDGKALYKDGQLITWDDPDWHHGQAARHFGWVGDDRPEAYVSIEPNGQFDVVDLGRVRPEEHQWRPGEGWASDDARNEFAKVYDSERKRFEQAIQQIRPDLKRADWRLAHTEHQLNYQPGSWGKGLIDANGVIHTWNSDGHDGQPTHVQYLADHDLAYPLQDAVEIRPSGELAYPPRQWHTWDELGHPVSERTAGRWDPNGEMSPVLEIEGHRYVGQPGQAHVWLANENGLNGEQLQAARQGLQFGDGSIEWYDDPKTWKLTSITSAVGVTSEGHQGYDTPWDAWDAAKEMNPEKPLAKGLTDELGREIFWPVSDESGYPHHEDVAEHLRIVPADTHWTEGPNGEWRSYSEEYPDEGWSITGNRIDDVWAGAEPDDGSDPLPRASAVTLAPDWRVRSHVNLPTEAQQRSEAHAGNLPQLDNRNEPDEASWSTRTARELTSEQAQAIRDHVARGVDEDDDHFKWIEMPDGTRYEWATDGPAGDPHHFDVAKAFDLDLSGAETGEYPENDWRLSAARRVQEHEFEVLDPMIGRPYVVGPEGTIHLGPEGAAHMDVVTRIDRHEPTRDWPMGIVRGNDVMPLYGKSDEEAKQALRDHLGLEPEQDWTLSRTATVVKQVATGEMSDLDRDAYGAQPHRPMLYSPKDDTIYVGDHGSHHAPLYEAANYPHDVAFGQVDEDGSHYYDVRDAGGWNQMVCPHCADDWTQPGGVCPKCGHVTTVPDPEEHQRLVQQALDQEERPSWTLGRTATTFNYESWKPGTRYLGDQDWTLSARFSAETPEGVEPWRPGVFGKWLMIGGKVYAWGDDGLHHEDVGRMLGDVRHIDAVGEIDMNGNASVNNTWVEDGQAEYELERAGLKPITNDRWGLGSASRTARDISQKAMVTEDGKVAAWPTDEYGNPHHDDILQDQDGLYGVPWPRDPEDTEYVQPARSYWVVEDGTLTYSGGEAPGDQQLVRDHLGLREQDEPDWRLGKQVLPEWKPGLGGRAILDDQGRAHLWADNSERDESGREQLDHIDGASALGLIGHVRGYYFVGTDGTIEPAWADDDLEGDRDEALRQTAEQLGLKPAGPGWNLEARVASPQDRKALVTTDGKVVGWKTNSTGWPHHWAVLDQGERVRVDPNEIAWLTEPWDKSDRPRSYWVTHSGWWVNAGGVQGDQALVDQVLPLDSRSEWNLESAVAPRQSFDPKQGQRQAHVNTWKPGEEGRAIVTPGGVAHVWGDDGVNHYQYMQQHGVTARTHWFIDPQGRAGGWEDEELHPDTEPDKRMIEQLTGANPTQGDSAPGWTLGRNTSVSPIRPAWTDPSLAYARGALPHRGGDVKGIDDPAEELRRLVGQAWDLRSSARRVTGRNLSEEGDWGSLATPPGFHRWMPGLPGKGISKDGQEYWWAIDTEGDGEPAHSAGLEAVLGRWKSPRSEGWTCWYVTPNGEAHDVTQPNYPDDEGWTLSRESRPSFALRAPLLKRAKVLESGLGQSQSRASSLAWRPGIQGKGLITRQGIVHTWPTDNSGAPHHVTKAERHGWDIGDVPAEAKTFAITPDGAVSNWYPELAGHFDVSYQGDGLRRRREDDQWILESGVGESGRGATPIAPGVPPGFQPWVEGQWGKSLVLPDGTEYRWTHDMKTDQPTHVQAAAALGVNYTSGLRPQMVRPDGSVWDPWQSLESRVATGDLTVREGLTPGYERGDDLRDDQGKPTGEKDYWHRDRRPAVYAPEGNTVFLGQPGTHHEDLYEEFPELERQYRKTHELVIEPDGTIGNYWLSHLPEDERNRVYNALGADEKSSWSLNSRIAGGSIPVVVDATTGRHWIGKPGQYHAEVWDDQGIEMDRPDLNAHHGLVMNDPEKGRILEWYEGVPHPEATAAVSRQLGEPVTDVYAESLEDGSVVHNEFPDQWNLSRTAENSDLRVVDSPITTEQSTVPFANLYTHSPWVSWNGTIYLGQAGVHHEDLIREHEIPTNANLNSEMGDGWGAVDNGMISVGEGYDPRALADALHDHLGPGFGESLPEEDEDDWTLSRTAHDLRWEPGSPGKGYLTKDGFVSTWKTDAEGPYSSPHHYQVLADLGIDPYESIDRIFTIGPGGDLDRALGIPMRSLNDESTAKITAADPRLQWTENDWKLGSRVAKLDVEHTNYGRGFDPESMDRLPVIYHPKTKTVYIGPPGAYHSHLEQKFKPDTDGSGEDVYHGFVQNGQLTWSFGGPHNGREVAEAIGYPEEDWTLEGRAAAPTNAERGQSDEYWSRWHDDWVDDGYVLPSPGHNTYEPGEWGKAAWEPVYGLTAWSTVGGGGDPHHPDHTTVDFIIHPDGTYTVERVLKEEDEQKAIAAIEAAGFRSHDADDPWTLSRTAGDPSQGRAPEGAKPWHQGVWGKGMRLSDGTEWWWAEDDRTHASVWMDMVRHRDPHDRPLPDEMWVVDPSGRVARNDADRWALGSRQAANDDWEPGAWGKAVLWGPGDLVSWKTTPDGDPHHYDLVGDDLNESEALLTIGPDGTYDVEHNPDRHPDPEWVQREVNRIDDRLRPYEPWNLSRTAGDLSYRGVVNGGHEVEHAPHHAEVPTEPWEPGQTGKAIFRMTPDGAATFHVWRTDEDEYPHHSQVMAPMREFDDRGMPVSHDWFSPGFTVDPDGRLDSPYNGPWDKFIPEPFYLDQPWTMPDWNLRSRVAKITYEGPWRDEAPQPGFYEGVLRLKDGRQVEFTEPHVDVLRKLGLTPDDVEEFGYFKRDGSYGSLEYSRDTYEKQWTLSRASHERYHVLDREPPWSDYADENPWAEAYDDPEEAERARLGAQRPFVVTNDKIHLGEPGMSHLDMFDQIPEGASTGIVNPAGQVYLYDRGHPDAEQIKQTVRDHVGAPNWNLSRTAAVTPEGPEPWKPGLAGKGIVTDGVVYLWAVTPTGKPGHNTVLAQDPRIFSMTRGWNPSFVVSPSGEFADYEGELTDQERDLITDAGLTYAGGDYGMWGFSKVAAIQVPPNGSFWEPGHWGKGTTVNGTDYLWRAENAKDPHHADVADAVMDAAGSDEVGHDPDGYLHVMPDGTIQYEGYWDLDQEDRFLAQDSRLRRADDSTWTVSSTGWQTPPGLKPWTPGRWGKGLTMHDGTEYAWATNQIMDDPEPTHTYALEAIQTHGGKWADGEWQHARDLVDEEDAESGSTFLGDEYANVASLWQVSPDGQRQDANDVQEAEESRWDWPGALSRVRGAGTKLAADVEWETPPGEQPWEPGVSGKGIVTPDRRILWEAHDDGFGGLGPHHEDVFFDQFDHDPTRPDSRSAFLYVGEGGGTNIEDLGAEAEAKRAVEEDPRLYLIKDEDDWSLTASVVPSDPEDPNHPWGAVTLRDGTVHVWPQDYDRYQAHAEYMHANGIHPDDVADYWQWVGSEWRNTGQFTQDYRDIYNALANTGDDKWKLGAWGDSKYDPETGEWEVYEPWEPGNYGKGLLYEMPDPDGGRMHDLITWSVGEYGTAHDPGYHHGDMVQRYDLAVLDQMNIDPDGSVSNWEGGKPRHLDEILRLDPRLKPAESTLWNFSAVQTQNGGHEVKNYLGTGRDFVTEPWRPGIGGKAVLWNGGLHMWSVDGFDPHHDGMLDHLLGGYDARRREDPKFVNDVYMKLPMFRISPAGEIYSAGGDTSDDHVDEAASLYPGLSTGDGGWTLKAGGAQEDPSGWKVPPGSWNGISFEPWMRGSYGKAIRMRSGVVYGWLTGPGDGQPTHERALRALGYEDYRAAPAKELLSILPDGTLQNRNEYMDDWYGQGGSRYLWQLDGS